jgi:hypothetical protein
MRNRSALPTLGGADARWQLAGYATVAALALIPAACLIMFGLPARNDSYPFVTFALTLMVILCLWRPLQLVAKRHDAPAQQLAADLRTNWPWLASVALMALALPQTLDSATSLKKHIPDFNPYYADLALIRLDAVFGVDPWRITHGVFGETATRLIDRFYALWHVEQIGLLIWLVLARNRRFQIQAALSFQLAWLFMGGIMALAFASVGPCFVDDFLGSDYYAPLMARLPDDLLMANGMNYLLATQGQDAIGGGISAMPSLHVAIAVLTALCIRDRFPKWQWLAWSYAAIIYIGSIHLGWHYASDGIVSGVGMVAIWKGTGWYMDVLDRSLKLAVSPA